MDLLTLESVRQGENGQHDQREPSSVRLEWRPVGQRVQEVLGFHGSAEAQVCDQHDNPGNVARNGGDVDKPGEDYSGC